ncbi:hypothetical protein QUB10_18340 [Microcoleus sp. B5-D4]|uniref:hypothetical protein n=1 Tax=unclassified Microcoleus TaxID=2642155 RepID=UPI002FD345D7
MTQNTEVSIGGDVITGNVRLQTEVNEFTKNYLRIEAIRQNVTMGQLLDKIIKRLCEESELQAYQKATLN